MLNQWHCGHKASAGQHAHSQPAAQPLKTPYAVNFNALTEQPKQNKAIVSRWPSAQLLASETHTKQYYSNLELHGSKASCPAWYLVPPAKQRAETSSCLLSAQMDRKVCCLDKLSFSRSQACADRKILFLVQFAKAYIAYNTAGVHNLPSRPLPMTLILMLTADCASSFLLNQGCLSLEAKSECGDISVAHAITDSTLV